MPGTAKLLPAALLTLCLILAGATAGPAAARTAGKSHHHGKRSHHALRPRATHVKARSKAQTVAPAGKTQTVRSKTRTVKSHSKAQNLKPSAVKTAGEAQTPNPLDAGAATIAGVLATPCENTEITPEAGNVAAAREAVLCLVNHTRAEHSLAPLKLNAQLTEAAEGHNAEMLGVDYFAHVAPDGETPVERIEKTGYIASESLGYVIGENLAWGTYSLSTPQAIVEAWIASPGHLANILESRYTETGIGVAAAVPQSLAEGNPGATYAQEFGVIVH